MNTSAAVLSTAIVFMYSSTKVFLIALLILGEGAFQNSDFTGAWPSNPKSIIEPQGTADRRDHAKSIQSRQQQGSQADSAHPFGKALRLNLQKLVSKL